MAAQGRITNFMTHFYVAYGGCQGDENLHIMPNKVFERSEESFRKILRNAIEDNHS